ncbi:MAG: WYL domain-containing protein [Eubacteriales bacterium]|nr:WYL domain-containing protein [Eubacteriales bacterium]
MPKGTNQKFKLYRLAQIMLERTDEEHYITMPEILEALGKYDVTADRKSVYADLRDLEVLGIEVEGEPSGKGFHYHVVNRPFELPELKLLVDAIQSSKFITEKKSNILIRKLEKLVSKYEAMKLQRQVYVAGRIKTMNESIYYTVDAIHNAISENRKIRFQYYQWNVRKEMEPRHGGAYYDISPWGLSWSNENYYLIGYDSDTGRIKHYRVDKMLHIRMTDEPREGKEHFKTLDMADYTKKSFSMFGGEEQAVRLLMDNSLAGVVIDRFGKDVMMIPEDEGHFTVSVEVHVSRQFLGWIFSLGGGARLLGPESVVEQMRQEVRRMARQYGLSEYEGE